MNTLAASAFAASVIFFAYDATASQLCAGDRLVRFTNETRQLIAELYVSAAGGRDWHGDLLGSNYLAPGASVLVQMADPNERCRIDVKMVLDDGSERISHGVSIFRAEGWTAALR